MQSRRWPVAGANALAAMALLAAGAPLAIAAVGGLPTLFSRSHETGYLLYPHSGLCAQSRTNAAAASTRRSAPPFRPTRTADAVTPPELGQSLGPQWLGPGSKASEGARSPSGGE
jgi:hypothetical protein